MDIDDATLDRLQHAYQAAAEAWIAAIRAEAALASVPHTVAEIDTWEAAHFLTEHAARDTAVAKAAYENGLRARFFGID